MKDGARMGMAVGLGYLLGRTRKMRLALMLVGVGITGRVGKNPAALVKQGVDVLGSSPEFKTLTETARGRLVEAGKDAAISAVSSRVDSLTGKIEERTGALSSSPLGGKAEQADEDTGENTVENRGRDTDTAEREQDEEDTDEKAAERRPRRTSTRRPRRTEPADDPEDEDRAEARPRRPARPSRQRPPVRRTRRREQ